MTATGQQHIEKTKQQRYRNKKVIQPVYAMTLAVMSEPQKHRTQRSGGCKQQHTPKDNLYLLITEKAKAYMHKPGKLETRDDQDHATTGTADDSSKGQRADTVCERGEQQQGTPTARAHQRRRRASNHGLNRRPRQRWRREAMQGRHEPAAGAQAPTGPRPPRPRRRRRRLDNQEERALPSTGAAGKPRGRHRARRTAPTRRGA